MKSIILAGVAVMSLGFAATANAKIYDFSFSASNGDAVYGTFTTNVTNGVVAATGNAYLPTLDGTISDGFVDNGVSIAGSAGSPYTTPSGSYIVDNNYGVDSYGLYLTTFNGREINIYADTLADGPAGIDPAATIYAGQGAKPAYVGIYDTSNGLDGQEFGSLTISAAVPEPATWLMMLFGVGLMGAALRFGRKRNLSGLAA